MPCACVCSCSLCWNGYHAAGIGLGYCHGNGYEGRGAIPANPQRIVDVAGLTEELLILDMKVIASANTSMFDGVSVPKHLTTLFAERGIEVVGNYSGSSSTGDLNLEKIAELTPDLSSCSLCF